MELHLDHFTAKDGTHYRIDGVLRCHGCEPQVTWHSYTLENFRATIVGMGEGSASDWAKMKETL